MLMRLAAKEFTEYEKIKSNKFHSFHFHISKYYPSIRILCLSLSQPENPTKLTQQDRDTPSNNQEESSKQMLL